MVGRVSSPLRRRSKVGLEGVRAKTRATPCTWNFIVPHFVQVRVTEDHEELLHSGEPGGKRGTCLPYRIRGTMRAKHEGRSGVVDGLGIGQQADAETVLFRDHLNQLIPFFTSSRNRGRCQMGGMEPSWSTILRSSRYGAVNPATTALTNEL
ncbi:hypothetical protein BJV74DRAFT_859420 [Russula compacta]|nr:hypothetical protein BJV74DRAFT_859420 [Russula compacta]